MALSEIGKKIPKREVRTIPEAQVRNPVVFGLPQNQQTPDLKGTMTTAQTTPQSAVKPVAFKAPEVQPTQPKPSASDIVQFDKSRGVSISQAPVDPQEQRREGLRKIPLIGTTLFGRGYNKLYEQDTVAGAVEKGGVTGFLFEGFTRTQSPTFEEQADRVYERYDKLVTEGIDEERAWEAAVQDTINKTAPNYRNITELREAANNPSIELTEEEQDILTMVNAKEKLFTVLDAPIFVGSTRIARQGAEELVEKALPVKDGIINRLEQPVRPREGMGRGDTQDVLGSDENNEAIQKYLEDLKKNKQPSITQLNEGLELIRVSGREYQDIADELVAITQDIAKNPSKYIQDPETGRMQGSISQQDSVSQRAAQLEPFEDTGEVTVRTIADLEGRNTVSYQFIADSLKRPDVKQAERDVVADVLSEYEEGAKIPVAEFADKVKARLLPVEQVPVKGEWQNYENINLPPDLRGNVASYTENIYRSPISNSSGEVHFSSLPPGVRDGYFAHTRVEDMADNSTRRVIELQSDLFQKGRLEQQTVSPNNYGNTLEEAIARYKENFGVKDRDLLPQELKQVDEFMKDQAERTAYNESLTALQPYRNTWWERIIREEVKKAAEDGKSVLQFPTGETAMKVEGLGGVGIEGFTIESPTLRGRNGTPVRRRLTTDELKVGQETYGHGDNWIITEVLENGKFKAVPKSKYDEFKLESQYVIRNQADGDIETAFRTQKEADDYIKKSGNEDLVVTRNSVLEEQFDISGKIDTNNPIYKFYEKDVQKYLTKKYGGKVVTDENGVSWVQIAVNPQFADKPVEAFAGAAVGIEEDEEGNITIDPSKAFLGMAAAGFLGINFRKSKARIPTRSTGAPDVPSSRLAQPVLPEGTLPKAGTEEARLASSNVVDSLSADYAQTVGESTVDTERALNPSTMKPRSAKPEDMTRFQKMREHLDNKWTQAMQWFQDDMIKVRNLVSNPNVKVTDDTDPWLAEILFHGRIGARLTEARDRFIAIDKDILTTAKTNGVPDQDMAILVNKFLHSRHAPERNARLGDGAAGLTNAEAKVMQMEIEALPYGKEVARIADQVQAMNNETLDILREAQVIDDEAYKAMREAYQNHVPLQRILDEDTDMVQALTGRGFDVKSTGIKRAKGSDREVADIMTNVVTNYEQALIRAEKNRVDLTTLAFARDNKALGLFEEIKPKVIGRGFDKPEGALSDIARAELSDRPMPDALASVADGLRAQIEDAWARIYNEFDYASAGQRKSVVFEKDGVIDRIESTRSTFPEWVPEELRSKELFNKVLDLHSSGKVPRKNAIQQRELLDVMEERVLKYLPLEAQDELALSYLARESETLASVYEKVKGARGRLIYEQITDPRVLTLRENGKPVFLKIKNEDLAMALKGVSRHQVPSYMSGVRAFTSFYSGLQTRFNPEFAFPNKIRDLQEAVVYAGSRAELGFSGGIKGALDQKAYKDVLDYIRGVDTEGARLYQQMIEDGGTTGGMALSTREAVELDIQAIRKLNRSNPRAAADKVIRLVDDFNTIFEDSTRLSLYKQAIKRGVSRKRAALIAKEASINFNKFGRGGPIINSLWMFSNASIQGTTKMMRAMKDPKVAAGVSASVFAGVYAAGEWNDTLDEDWRDKVTEWDRINSLVLVLPSSSEDEFNYVTIPVGWGIKPIKVGADYLYDASVGKGATTEEAFSGIVASAINAYNPVGGTDILSGLTPTIADIPSEIYRNQSWHGGKIMPDWDMRKDHLRYYPSLTDNTTGQTMVEISSGLTGIGIEISPASLNYAYEGYIGGAGRTTSDTVNMMISLGRGEMPDSNDIPVWSRFVKQRDVDEIGAGSNEHERVKQLEIEEDSERAILNFKAEDAMKRLNSVEPDEAAKLFDELAKKDPELAEKIVEKKEEEALGLTYTQRNLKGLTVESRANYIYDKLESLESDEEKAELWDEYVEKKIITESVAEEITAIRNGERGYDMRPDYEDGQTTTQQSFISKMKLYADAIGTDPVTAFNRMMTGQTIRRIDGGAIIVERMPLSESQAVRAERGATEEMRLDHTIPLQLGGSNAEDNLKLVPYSEWERYTVIENLLGEALRDERIDGKEAQRLIREFKEGKLTSQQVRDAIDNQ